MPYFLVVNARERNVPVTKLGRQQASSFLAPEMKENRVRGLRHGENTRAPLMGTEHIESPWQERSVLCVLPGG